VSDGQGNILLLSGEQVADELASLAPAEDVAHHTDPYDALEELARKRYRGVILTHPYPDFPGLVRAVRLLQRSSRILALCSPAGEADLRLTGLGELDDYFLYPPTAEDVARMFRLEAAAGAAEPTAAGGAALSQEEISELIERAGSVSALAEHVRKIVSDQTGLTVRWRGDAASDEGGQELLLLDGDPPRILLTDASAELSELQREKLRSLQGLLGPLAAQARRTEALHRLAITDHLTGAYNRRYFYHFTDQVLDRARTERFRATVLLFDIDDFKRYNDTFGHAAGDEILREATRLMRQVTREHDIVARIGGDEFAVLFWDAEPPRRPDSQHPQDALAIAARFVAALKKHEFASLGPDAKGVLTISGGLATFPWDGKTCRDMLRHADGALRRAKASGKAAIYLVGTGDRD